jgi:LPS-assembly lipoprotein
MTRRLASLALAAALLTGCGFHLRNALNLPANLGPVRVLASDPYSALAENLAMACNARAHRPTPRPGVATCR